MVEGARFQIAAAPRRRPAARYVAQPARRLGYAGAAFELRRRGHDEHRERPQRRLKDKLYHGAYPVREAYGVVFAYMGPPEKQPPSRSTTLTSGPAGG